MKRPNVLLLYTDQQRWDALRCAGNEHILTPNLDALAASGALFRNAFCNSPVCMPSRQSMLSGQYPSAIGSTCNGIEMREDVPTVHSVLKPYGYHAANIGKLHFKNHSNRDHRQPHPGYGFDTLILSEEPGCYDDAYIKWVAEKDPAQVENCRCGTPPAWTGAPIAKPHGVTEPYAFEGPEGLTHTAFVADETCDFVRRRRGNPATRPAGGPFFCIAGFYAPHAPLNPPHRFVDMYDPARLPLPRMNEGENRLGLSDDQWRRVKAYYYALVSHVDDQVGRILAALDEAGLREETLVIFTSDHGEHLGDHGLTTKGPPGLDSCAHVPLIVSWPGRVPAGLAFDELVELVDVAPTVLDYCGVQAVPFFQGRSLRPLIEGGKGYVPRSSAFIEHRVPDGPSWKSVRTHRFEYCLSDGGRELLFDLRSDPHELRDVSGERRHARSLWLMRQELLRRWFEVEARTLHRTGRY
jgi:arylsulfatase A-like enzyme